MVKLCTSCSNAIFHPLWGDYKCKVKQRYVYGPVEKCDDYVKGAPSQSGCVDEEKPSQRPSGGNTGGSTTTHETYSGSYTITPRTTQQVLHTAQKLMKSNVVIKKIPYHETSNDGGGNTVYIAKEL